MPRPTPLLLLAPLYASVLMFATDDAVSAELDGSLVAWQPLTLSVSGPSLHERDTTPNPFLDIRLDVLFTSPSGEHYRVPGFFAGNGAGIGNGDQWQTRFAPDQAGDWRYEVLFHQGSEIAVQDSTDGAATLPAHGENGSFRVAPPDTEAPGFLGRGRLDHVGEHYLRLADGRYWIKGGVDSPENFLAYVGFDNTIDQGGSIRPGSLDNGLHRYDAHRAHWTAGDPDFMSADTGDDGRGIIGAINYLADQGINSLYFLPMNLGGDGQEVYPFVGPSGSRFDNTHYDISKLHQWNIVFEHMQAKGIAAHVVLGEQEFGNTHWLDDGELGVERKLFYRELIARFGYLNALKWNLSEESQYSDALHEAFAAWIKALDPVDHPLAVHTWVDRPIPQYEVLLGNPHFDITSIQFSAENANAFTEVWRERSAAAGRPWVIDMDELGPGNVGLSVENIDDMRRSVLYPVYFSGGNIEWYFGRFANDIGLEDFQPFEPMYRAMRHARTFLEALPFHLMQPNDKALQSASEHDQVFSLPQQVHAVYLENGQAGRRLAVTSGDWSIRWYDPLTGNYVGDAQVVSGSELELGAAPRDPQQDWVLRVETHDTGSGADSDSDAGEDTEPSLGAAGSSGSSGSGALDPWLLIGLFGVVIGVRRVRRTSAPDWRAGP